MTLDDALKWIKGIEAALRITAHPKNAERRLETIIDAITSLRIVASEREEEVVVLTEAQFKELPDYSMSLPTGTRIGKRWRSDLNAALRYHARESVPEHWRMGEYFDMGSKTNVGIRWTKIAVVRGVPNAPAPLSDAERYRRKLDAILAAANDPTITLEGLRAELLLLAAPLPADT